MVPYNILPRITPSYITVEQHQILFDQGFLAQLVKCQNKAFVVPSNITCAIRLLHNYKFSPLFILLISL